jgi:hypothetical protein
MLGDIGLRNGNLDLDLDLDLDLWFGFGFVLSERFGGRLTNRLRCKLLMTTAVGAMSHSRNGRLCRSHS